MGGMTGMEFSIPTDNLLMIRYERKPIGENR
jgi:hypothetical protein